MKSLKNLLKMLAGLAAGVAAGFVIAGVGLVLFTDITLAEYWGKITSLQFGKAFIPAVLGVVSFIVSLPLIILVHEAGHLVCGLLTGYKFVSFRIFNWVIIRRGDTFVTRRFSVAGTGGQCLLSPPDLPFDMIPTVWYNAGGVLANLALLAAVSLLLIFIDNPYAIECMVVFLVTDLIIVLINGIPMKAGGVQNDAYNIIHLDNSELGKRSFVLQLRTNALIQEGVRPKDMPDRWFEWTTAIDFSNAPEVAVPLMHASRLIDMMEWEEAYAELKELYAHRDLIMGLYVNEIACELAFCSMVTGRPDEASALLDNKLLKYVDSYKGVMSGKQRLLCAQALYLDRDRTKAEEICNNLRYSADKYLLQGEVNSDIAIMEWILCCQGDDMQCECVGGGLMG